MLYLGQTQIGLHGSKPRLELNGRAGIGLGGGGGVVNSVSIKGRGICVLLAGLLPVPRTAFLSMNAKSDAPSCPGA